MLAEIFSEEPLDEKTLPFASDEGTEAAAKLICSSFQRGSRLLASNFSLLLTFAQTSFFAPLGVVGYQELEAFVGHPHLPQRLRRSQQLEWECQTYSIFQKM